MKVHADFWIRDIEHELYNKSEEWRSCEDMRVGEWLEKIAIDLIKNDTHNQVATSPTLREYGPQVSYEEMKNILDDSFGCDEVRFDLVYNSSVSTWTIETFIVPASFYKAMESVKKEKEQDTNSYRHETWIPKITVGEIFGGLLYGTGGTESKTIAQWILQASKERIKNYCNKEYLKDATVTMASFLNFMGYGTRYSWEDLKHILKLSGVEDTIIFALDVQGTNIKIANMILPDSMENAIKKVHEEIEEDKKQYREFSVGEIFTGLMLAKNDFAFDGKYTAILEYGEWLKSAAQMLFKQDGLECYSPIQNNCEPEITWDEAIVEFAKRNNYGDKFTVTYTLKEVEKCIDYHNQIVSEPKVTVCDIRKISAE